MSEPLQPFVFPAFMQQFLFGNMLPWFLYLVLFFWMVYTVVAVYHWFRYSHASLIALPSIAVHLLVSSCILAYIFV